jgi:nucleolar protein 14
MQRRNKVGGILDRRFGENDPDMAPEDKMLERFAHEKQKTHKKTSLFDLEGDEPIVSLTHQGQALTFNGPNVDDDFEEEDLGSGDESDSSMAHEKRLLKRMRLAEALAADGETEEGADDGQPDRKKTKQEVMKEVIAKSKMHKYERQATKDENDDLREELDRELP